MIRLPPRSPPFPSPPLSRSSALVAGDPRQKAGSVPPGDVQTYNVGPAGQHTEGSVDYPQSPPVGGEHNPIWQNCGLYEEPVRNETAVHSLEHRSGERRVGEECSSRGSPYP